MIKRLLFLFDRFQSKLEDRYEALMKVVLQNRLKTLLGAAFIFVASLMLGKTLPKNFVPAGDNGDFLISIEKPVGISLAGTREQVLIIEKIVKEHPAIELISSTIGSASGLTEANRAELYVRLVPRKNRKQVTSEVKEDLRAQLRQYEAEAK